MKPSNTRQKRTPEPIPPAFKPTYDLIMSAPSKDMQNELARIMQIYTHGLQDGVRLAQKPA